MSASSDFPFSRHSVVRAGARDPHCAPPVRLATCGAVHWSTLRVRASRAVTDRIGKQTNTHNSPDTKTRLAHNTSAPRRLKHVTTRCDRQQPQPRKTRSTSRWSKDSVGAHLLRTELTRVLLDDVVFILRYHVFTEPQIAKPLRLVSFERPMTPPHIRILSSFFKIFKKKTT